MRFKIQTLNNISIKGLERLPRDRFEVASEINNPDAILVRSADMHKIQIPDTVRAIGRAGAGTNNIPVEALSKKGVPVFNAPGANANAVKELVLAGMFLAARNITQAWAFARSQQGDDHAIDVGRREHLVDAVGQLEPDLMIHRLAADVGRLLAGKLGHVLELRHGIDQVVHRERTGLVAGIGLAGLGAGDRASPAL